MRLLLLTIAALLLSAQVPQPQESVPSPEWGVHPTRTSYQIDKEDMSVGQLLSGWVSHVGMFWQDDPEVGQDKVRGYGLDPSSPTVQRVVEVWWGIQSRFNPRELVRRYREAGLHFGLDREELARRGDKVRRQFGIERAHTAGQLIGAWLADLEAEGVDVEELIRTIRNMPGYTAAIAFINEEPDFERLHHESEICRREIERELGRPLELPEIRQ